jgi:hypothetical protein
MSHTCRHIWRRQSADPNLSINQPINQPTNQPINNILLYKIYKTKRSLEVKLPTYGPMQQESWEKSEKRQAGEKISQQHPARDSKQCGGVGG